MTGNRAALTPTEFSLAVADRVVTVARDQGLSVNALALKVSEEISRSRAYRLLRDRTQIMTMNDLDALCRALEVAPSSVISAVEADWYAAETLVLRRRHVEGREEIGSRSALAAHEEETKIADETAAYNET